MKILQTFITLAFFINPTASVSGVVNKELEATADVSAIINAAEIPGDNLRCWQKGKLLFEEIDYGLSSNNNNMHMIKFNHNQIQDRSLGLINFGETFCVYQRTE